MKTFSLSNVTWKLICSNLLSPPVLRQASLYQCVFGLKGAIQICYYPPFASRAKGEVFVLLLLFCSFFCQRFLDNPRANSRQILHAGVLWFRMCLLPFWGLAAAGGRKKGEMKFLLLWESMGNFCILAVFERYLSNACTDPHQILFV